MREIQHKNERLNFGKDNAVRAPPLITSKIWIHLIFNRGLFFSFGRLIDVRQDGYLIIR